jgi:hypothetical protein
MSYEESDIINQALQYLIEDNKKLKKIAFVKISAKLPGVKETSDGKFSPVQYWLDKAQSDSQSKVKQLIQYQNSFDSTQYLGWAGRNFLRFINDFPELRRYTESTSVKKDIESTDQVSLKSYFQTTITTPDVDFTKESFYIDLDGKMSVVFEMILKYKILPGASSASGTTGGVSSPETKPLSLDPAPQASVYSLGTSNVFENYDEVLAYQFIKQSCENSISQMANNPAAMAHITGSTRGFDYDAWWRNIRTLYMNVPEVISILQTMISEAVPEQYAVPPVLTDIKDEDFEPRTAAIRPFDRVGPFRNQTLKAVDKSGSSSPGNPRVFSLYQLGLIQTGPADSSAGTPTKPTGEETVEETGEETVKSTVPESEEPSPKSTEAPVSKETSVVDSLNFEEADFEAIFDSINSRTSQMNLDRIVLAAPKVKQKIIDVIVKRSDIAPVVNNLLSIIENDLNRRSKQIQDSFDKNVGIAKNVSDIGGMALTNLSKGFNAKSPTRGIL